MTIVLNDSFLQKQEKQDRCHQRSTRPVLAGSEHCFRLEFVLFC